MALPSFLRGPALTQGRWVLNPLGPGGIRPSSQAEAESLGPVVPDLRQALILVSAQRLRFSMVGGEGGGWRGCHDSTCQPSLDSGYKLGGHLRQRPCLGDCGGCWGAGTPLFPQMHGPRQAAVGGSLPPPLSSLTHLGAELSPSQSQPHPHPSPSSPSGL